MDQKMIDFCNQYKERINNIIEQYSSEPEIMQEKIEELEHKVAGIIMRAKLTDKDKIEMLKLFNDEDSKSRIIQTINDDDLKGQALFKHITSRMEQIEVFVTLKDKEKILNFLEQDANLKNEVVKYLKTQIRCNPKRMWEFMTASGLENQVIPYVLNSSKYEVVRRMTPEMRSDVEKYLGKPLPENIEEMSIYEKVGVDLDALQGEVVTSDKQLGLDEFQKRYLQAMDRFGSPTRDNCKRKISIRDFGGTFSPTLAEDVVATPKNWEELLRGLKRMKDNIQHHSEEGLFNPEINEHQESLGLKCINGKYYISGNGNHRMTLLKAKYLSEVKRANGDPQRLAEIEEKYTIEATYVTELPQNSKELMGICTLDMINGLTENKKKIEELTENRKKTGYIITEGETISVIKTESELQEYLQQQIAQLRESDDGRLFERFNDKIRTLNLDLIENEQYKKAFEEMTGITLEQKQENFRINEFGEIIREQPSNAQIPEEEQPEIIRTRDESIRDEIGQEDKSSKQMDDSKVDVNLWMSRGEKFYFGIDRAEPKLKDKLIQMKSDIINAIRAKLQERINSRKEQDTSERG